MKHATIRLAFALSAAAIALPAAAYAASDEPQAQASDRGLYLTLIRQARDDGHARAALAFLDDFERRYPGDTDATILRINCLLDLEQVGAAQAAAAALPVRKASGPVRAARGHVFAALGEWEQAVGEYDAALDTIPSDTLANNALGYAQLRAGRLTDAVETLKRARELAPQDPVIRNNLLLALTVAGRTEEADALLYRSGSEVVREKLRRQVGEEAARIAAQPREPEPQT